VTTRLPSQCKNWGKLWGKGRSRSRLVVTRSVSEGASRRRAWSGRCEGQPGAVSDNCCQFVRQGGICLDPGGCGLPVVIHTMQHQVRATEANRQPRGCQSGTTGPVSHRSTLGS